MTSEEAIKELKEDKALHESDIIDAGDGTPEGQIMLAIDMAIEALEKQMPKEAVIQKISKSIEMLYCPRCHVRFIRMGMNYCGDCGQALDWDNYK